MAAAVWRAPHEVELRRVPVPDPGDDLALIRVRFAGLCPTDRLLTSGGLSAPQPPLIPGHEVTGVVRRAPAARPDLLGRRVVIDPAPSATRSYGLGELGLDRDGGWAEYCLADPARLHVLPDDLPDSRAVLAEPFAMTWGAVDSVRADVAGARVLVVGDGLAAYGFAAAMGLRGAAEVVVAGRDAGRGELFAPLPGTTFTTARLPPDSFDVTVDAAGTTASLDHAIASVRPHGHVLLYGFHEPRVGFPLEQAVMKNLTLTGHTNPVSGWPEVIRALTDGTLPTGHLGLRIVPLTALTDVLDHDPRSVIRTVFDLDGPLGCEDDRSSTDRVGDDRDDF